MEVQSAKDMEIIRLFPRFRGKGIPEFITDFLGTRTRTAFIKIRQEERSGMVEDYPVGWSFHATALEWAGSLRSVLDAGSEYVAIELGAGWGPWLISMAFAAQSRGIRKCRLVGVEASKDHYEYMHTHFRDNGFDPDEHTLLHGIVGPTDGDAVFPILGDPALDYGRAAEFRDEPNLFGRLKDRIKRLRGAPAEKVERLKSYSIETLLAPFAQVNLLHMDIQGNETEVLPSALKIVQRKVRWMIIATHGRDIEESIRNQLHEGPWELETEEAGMFEEEGGKQVSIQDGCQVWRNTQLVGAARRMAS